MAVATPPARTPQKTTTAGQQRIGPFVILDEWPAPRSTSNVAPRVFRARCERGPKDAAFALDDGKVAVVKILRDAAMRDADVVNTFTREAELLAMIDHPNVVRAWTRGVALGRVWLAQEYVEGNTVEALLQVLVRDALRLRPETALVIALDTLAGLAAAQSMQDPRGKLMGLVHRRVCPRVLTIDGSGTTRIGDFSGVLLSVREEPKNDDARTERGAVFGYMSPEQARGEQITQSADVYGVGVVLFELLTGRRAFDIDALPEATKLEVHADNDRAAWPSHVDVPLDLRDLVDQMTASEPEKRPVDAAAAYALIEGLLSEPDDARERLRLVARDLAFSDPDRPYPMFLDTP
jgi:eukaryotic-like serine/threonine-protein kinase